MSITTKINKFILDTLFPITCLSCQENDVWLCDKCLNKIVLLDNQLCPYCEKIITEKGAVCPQCQNRLRKKSTVTPLDFLVCATRYKDPVSQLIHLYKYRFLFDLAEPLGKILIKSFLKNNLPLPDLIIPVPLHQRRLRWRGFNQAELLANYLGQNLTPGFSIPVDTDLIRREKYTTPQMKIKSYQERQQNLQSAFEINKKLALDTANWKDKTILLVDDVATTGSTLMECAKILKANGVKKVMGLVIARQEIEK